MYCRHSKQAKVAGEEMEVQQDAILLFGTNAALLSYLLISEMRKLNYERMLRKDREYSRASMLNEVAKIRR